MGNLNSQFLQKTSAKLRFSNEKGATMLEYAFIASLLAMVCLAGMSLLGVEVTSIFSNPVLLDAFN